jgi:hypothetical protein
MDNTEEPWKKAAISKKVQDKKNSLIKFVDEM